MADIIITPIAELFIGTLASTAVREIKSLWGVEDDLEQFERTLSTIRDVLVDAEKRQIHEELVRNWLEKLEAVLFAADDLVDGVGTEGLRQQLMPGKKIRKKVRTFFSSNNQLVFRHKIAREIRTIRERLDTISADKERFHFVLEEPQPARRVRDDSHSFVPEENVVGRDKDRREIVELLLHPKNGAHRERVFVIPIVGMGGLGKTTLAQLVFNDHRVQDHFDLKIWVCVSNDFGVKVLCEKIIKTITNERTENLEMEQLPSKLREKINGKRYLLVLDDVWNDNAQKWQDLKNLLTNCGEGSKIIVTTRSEVAANLTAGGTMQPYHLGILDPEESWCLFKKIAFDKGQDSANHIHREVHHVSFGFALELCDRLPSSLLQAKRLRSFLLINEGYKGEHRYQHQSICGRVMSNFKFIRMLDLHDMRIRRLANSVGKLKHLRYLDLSRNEIRRLPISITKLVNLQTLKLNDCYDFRELPSEIEKLVNLRHLELNHCGEITHMPRGLSQLTNLQTLSRFVLSDNVPNSLELIGFNNFKGDMLEISRIRRGMETTVTKLGENEHLRSLDLEFRRRDDDASSNESEWRTTLEGLQPHTNLRALSLVNYGGSNFDSFLSPLTKLVKLRLSSCSKCQKLPSLDQFHSLEEIYLSDFPALEYITINSGDRYFSTSTSPTISVSPSLQTLVLENLPNFRGWGRPDMAEENQVEQVIFPSFPRLSWLRILSCRKLTSMPCYPNVEGWLMLVGASWKHFERTVLMRVPQARISATTTTKTELEASSSSSVASSYSLSSHPLSKLTFLVLNNIVDLQYMPDDWMKGLTSLEELRILSCRELKYLSLSVQYPTSFEVLYIRNCEELEEIKWPHTPALTNFRVLELQNLPKLNISNLGQELQGSKHDSINETWQPLSNLRELTFIKLPQLVTLPEGLQFLTRLEVLEIRKCDDFTSLPDWISNLSSLQRLEIRDCPNFKSVPGSISSLTSLRRLEINGKDMDPTEIREDLDVNCRTPGPKSWKIPKKFRVPWLCNK